MLTRVLCKKLKSVRVALSGKALRRCYAPAIRPLTLVDSGVVENRICRAST